ncbi:CMD domain-containing protein [Enterobacteriaceae bacterium 4M9]|nr:CMD domain-containing protein [Enterobacteriaceae bacterium 4M9]
MEQRRATGKDHWYHETQSSLSAPEVVALAHVDDPFCLDLTLPNTLKPAPAWLIHARVIANSLLPDTVETSRFHTLSSYDRLSTALTVAQVYGVQRLCSHYAARLAPQPSPDSSRESNHRLTQITQYARLLASQPTLITARARQQLEDVGLSSADIITFHHIIGFIGFQARAIAALQALSNITVRWLTGLDSQQEADAAAFLTPTREWRAGIAVKNTLATPQVTSSLKPLAGVLAWDESTLQHLNTLIDALVPANTELATLCELSSARLNGCVARFDAASARWPGAQTLPEAIRSGEHTLQAWSDDARTLSYLQVLRQLTLSPASFSSTALAPLREWMTSDQDIWQLLGWCGLCGWLDRLYAGLGESD